MGTLEWISRYFQILWTREMWFGEIQESQLRIYRVGFEALLFLQLIDFKSSFFLKVCSLRKEKVKIKGMLRSFLALMVSNFIKSLENKREGKRLQLSILVIVKMTLSWKQNRKKSCRTLVWGPSWQPRWRG